MALMWDTQSSNLGHEYATMPHGHVRPTLSPSTVLLRWIRPPSAGFFIPRTG